MNNGGYYQNPVFPGVGLNNNTVPNQQSILVMNKRKLWLIHLLLNNHI